LPENTKIPFFRPPKLEPDEILYVESLIDMIVDSGVLTNGSFCRELEEMVSSLYHVDYVFTCSSGSVGLWIALNVLKTRKVIMPSFTWKSLKYVTANYEVKWLDIDRKTWLPKIEKKEVGTYIINLTFGNVDDYSDKIPKGSHLIYDGAHAFGARIPDWGDIFVFSLAPTKPFTTGEGGLIVTNDPKLAREIEQMRNACGRMTELQAVLGQIYLGKLGTVLTRRRKIWDYYRRRLPYKPQKIAKSTSYSVYGMLVEPHEREKLVKRIEGKMEYKIYYEPIHTDLKLKNTEYVYHRILCIPSYADVNEEKVVKICLGEIR